MGDLAVSPVDLARRPMRDDLGRALSVVSVVALTCVPLVRPYHVWTYDVLRRRIGLEPASAPSSEGSANV